MQKTKKCKVSQKWLYQRQKNKIKKPALEIIWKTEARNKLSLTKWSNSLFRFVGSKKTRRNNVVKLLLIACLNLLRCMQTCACTIVYLKMNRLEKYWGTLRAILCMVTCPCRCFGWYGYFYWPQGAVFCDRWRFSENKKN